MAFVLPIIEGIEAIGSAIFAAVEGTEAAGAALAASEAVYDLVPAAEGEAMAADAAMAAPEENAAQYFDMYDVDDPIINDGGDEIGYYYDQDWTAIQTEEPDIGANVIEGYPVEDAAPYQTGYWGAEGPPGYMRLAVDEDSYFLSDVRGIDPTATRILAFGAGKGIFVAGFWHILDPVTGAPVYAIAGDDPRVDAIMQDLGYTNNAKEAGLVVRSWFSHLFGNDTPYPAGTSTPAVSGSRRQRNPPTALQSLNIQKNLQNYSDPKIKMADRKKRSRSSRDYAAIAPASSVMRVPRPIMLAKAMRRRRPKVSYYTRTLGKIMTVNYWKVNNVVQMQLNDPFIQGAATGGSAAVNGIQWASGSACLAFRLSHFEQYQDLSSSFDQYRLKSVSIQFIPGQDSVSVEQANFLTCPTWVLVEDKDDINLGTNISNAAFLTSKQGNRVKRFDEPFTMRLSPKAWLQDASLVKSAVVGGWIPTSNFDVLHYGVKMAPIADTMNNLISAAPAYQVSIIIKCVVECKHAN